jgi:hypothetical protein
MPDWLAFLFGVIAGALVLAGGLLYADMRRERRDRQQVTDFERRNDERATDALQRLRAAAAEVERQRGEGA